MWWVNADHFPSAGVHGGCSTSLVGGWFHWMETSQAIKMIKAWYDVYVPQVLSSSLCSIAPTVLPSPPWLESTVRPCYGSSALRGPRQPPSSAACAATSGYSRCMYLSANQSNGKTAGTPKSSRVYMMHVFTNHMSNYNVITRIGFVKIRYNSSL